MSAYNMVGSIVFLLAGLLMLALVLAAAAVACLWLASRTHSLLTTMPASKSWYGSVRMRVFDCADLIRNPRSK